MTSKSIAAAGLQPEDVLVIDRPETLRLLAHPLRLRILELLRVGGAKGRTVKELAAALEVPQTRLYHHVNLLEAQGLIRVVATRQVSGITEKRYGVTAYRLSVERALLAPSEAGDDALEVLLSVVLDEVRSEIKRSVAAGLIDLTRSQEETIGPRTLLLGRRWLRLTSNQVVALNEAVREVFAQFPEADRDPSLEPDAARDEDAQLYESLIGFYPAVPPPLKAVGSKPPDESP